MMIGKLFHAIKIDGFESEKKLEWEKIVGKIDKYGRYKDKWIAVEIKTVGEKYKVQPQHILQLEYYYLLLRKNKLPIDELYLLYLVIKQRTYHVEMYRIEPRDEIIIEEEMLRKRDEILQQLEKILPDAVMGEWCAFCPYAKICKSSEKEFKKFVISRLKNLAVLVSRDDELKKSTRSIEELKYVFKRRKRFFFF